MKVTPEYISSLVNFYSNNEKPEWKYSPSGKDMRNLQVLGTAKVNNLLYSEGIALLADEVGMGKTIQSLAVCAALWNQKPDARILILAPRDEIAQNWMNEYHTFIRHHYRANDNIVKSISGQEPVHKMVYCENLYRLVHEIQQDWGHLFIGKISSFSSLLSRKDIVGRLEKLHIRNTARVRKLEGLRNSELNQEVALLLRKEILSHAKEQKPYFDLLIIDEAHYFRNKANDSLRVNTASQFFGNPSDPHTVPIAQKVLLLTATPNHSSSKDIGSIISYFSDKYIDKHYKEILDKICIRRLRRLSEKGFNKYNYRDEISSESSFDKNPLAELFFGLYQHELAKELNQKKQQRGRGGSGRQMMKYLEGVEFIPSEKRENNEGNQEMESNAISTDFSTGSDSEILLDLSNKFSEIFETAPGHPKYNRLVEDLTSKHVNEKAVVFVRRIPSVFEIANRVMEHYDQRMWSFFQGLPFATIPVSKLNRQRFNRSIGVDVEYAETEDIASEKIEPESNIPSSKVLNLFKKMENDRVKATHATNFRLRFNHSKPGIFTLFFSPGQDYFDQPYENIISHRFEKGNDREENFFNSALIHRTVKIEQGTAKDILNSLLSKNPLPKEKVTKKGPIPTLLTLFWEVFLTDPDIPVNYINSVRTGYSSFTYYEREAFSAFIEKGILLASEGVVWLYRIYLSLADKGEQPNALYVKFTKKVREGLRHQRMYHQIAESILHFRQIYSKEFSINGNKRLLEETWDSFNNAQPIYPYNADNSSKKILRCFNTPFFPDYLVATSVLQEGVNLQYFCNTIYHYGMAWTPGDNEQRIGRIDRMFGKIERLLKESADSTLKIYYPYLRDTIDEEQLARFVKRKYKEEQLLDMGMAYEEKADFVPEENDNNAWKVFLRSPEKKEISDPFPVLPDEFEGIQIVKRSKKAYSLNAFFHSIVKSISALKSFQPETYIIKQQEEYRVLVDPILTGGRKQPVVIELLYDPIGSGSLGRSVYCLQMKTPLAPFSKFRQLKTSFNSNASIQALYRPGIKLSIDPSHSGGNNWGIYMAYELPLFITDISINPLSGDEVQEAFTSLIACADKTEIEIFGRDLQKEELNLSADLFKDFSHQELRKAHKQQTVHRWKTRGEYHLLEADYEIKDESFDMEKQSLLMNHNTLYVKTFCQNEHWKHQVAYMTKDAHQEELDLLEKHFIVFLNRRDWK